MQRIQRQLPAVLRRKHRLDRSKSRTLGAQSASMGDQRLFGGVRHKTAILADSEAERDNAAEVAPALALVALDLGYAFADAVTLCLGDRRQDREDEFADPVARHVTTKVDHVQADVAGL